MQPREKKLLLGFTCTLLLVGLYMGAVHIWRWKADIVKKELKLDRALAERELLLSERDLWISRSDWMASQPIFDNQLTAESQLLKAVEDGARSSGLSIDQRSMLEAEDAPFKKQVGVSVVLVGGLDGVIKFMYQLQQPSNFRAIRKMRISPSKDDPAMLTCSLEIVRWYRPPEEA